MGGHHDAADLAPRTEAQQSHQLGIATAVSRVRSGSKAEVANHDSDVRYAPESGHGFGYANGPRFGKFLKFS